MGGYLHADQPVASMSVMAGLQSTFPGKLLTQTRATVSLSTDIVLMTRGFTVVLLKESNASNLVQADIS